MMRRFILIYVCFFMRRCCLTLSDANTKSTSTMTDENENKIKEYLCQGETLNITCPNNFVISFDDANFGRGHLDSERCPQFWGFENSHCYNHQHTLKVLNDKCHEQQKCFVPVDKDIFRNLCLTVTKYLYVKYHCKRKVNHGIINEGSPCAKHILTLNLLNVKSHERHHCIRPVDKYTLGYTSQSLENSDNSEKIEQTTYDGKEIDIRDDRKSKLDRKNRNNDRKKHSITTSILTTHYDKQPTTNPSILTTEYFHHYSTKEYVKKETKEIKVSMNMIIVVSVLVSISIAASVAITVLCYQRHRSKHSRTRPVRPDQIITERVDSSDYTEINYNEMTDMNLPETNENYYENNTTPRVPQAITNIIEKTGDTLTLYESLSSSRTSVEHVYELESTQNNQYQL